MRVRVAETKPQLGAPVGTSAVPLIAAGGLEKDRGFGGRVVPLNGLADRRKQHQGVRVRLEASRYLRDGRVSWFVFAEPHEAATAGDLEGAPRAVNRVGGVHEP